METLRHTLQCFITLYFSSKFDLTKQQINQGYYSRIHWGGWEALLLFSSSKAHQTLFGQIKSEFCFLHETWFVFLSTNKMQQCTVGLASSVIWCVGCLGNFLAWQVELLGPIGVTWRSKKQSQKIPIGNILPARSLQLHHAREILANFSTFIGLTKMSLIHSKVNGF